MSTYASAFHSSPEDFDFEPMKTRGCVVLCVIVILLIAFAISKAPTRRADVCPSTPGDPSVPGVSR